MVIYGGMSKMEYKVRVIGEADLKLLFDTLTPEQKESFMAEEIRKGWDVSGVLSLFSEDEIEDWLKSDVGVDRNGNKVV